MVKVPAQHAPSDIEDPELVAECTNIWPPGKYGTDGSAGKFSSIPELRRCGCAAVALDIAEKVTVLRGLSCPLPGEVQTVPRAELYGFFTVVRNVSHGLVEIVSDSKVNVDIYNKGRETALKATNYDIWQEIFKHIDTKTLSVKISWVQGHLDTKESKYWFSDSDFLHNFYADILADEAADRCQLPGEVYGDIVFNIRLVKRIQNRIIHIIKSKAKTAFDKKPKKEPLPSLESEAENSMHLLTQSTKYWFCVACNITFMKSYPGIRAWMRSPCAPLDEDDSVFPVRVKPWMHVRKAKLSPHFSHELYTFQKVLFCSKCGNLGAQRLKKLFTPCEFHLKGISDAGVRNLDFFWKGLLPPAVERPNQLSTNPRGKKRKLPLLRSSETPCLGEFPPSSLPILPQDSDLLGTSVIKVSELELGHPNEVSTRKVIHHSFDDPDGPNFSESDEHEFDSVPQSPAFAEVQAFSTSSSPSALAATHSNIPGPVFFDIDIDTGGSRILHRPLPVSSNPRRNLRRMSTKEAHELADGGNLEEAAATTTTHSSSSQVFTTNESSSSGSTANVCHPDAGSSRRQLRAMTSEEAFAEAFN